MQSLITGWLASHWLLVAAGLVLVAAVLQPVLVWKFKAWILLAVVLWWGWTGHAAHKALQADYRTHMAEEAAQEAAAARDAADERARLQAEARAAERRSAEQMAQIGQRLEQEKQDAIDRKDAVIAGLRAGDVRLRGMWAGCEAQSAAGVPAAAASAGERDEATERRFAGAGDLVRIADEADAQLAACQAVTQADRNRSATHERE